MILMTTQSADVRGSYCHHCRAVRKCLEDQGFWCGLVAHNLEFFLGWGHLLFTVRSGEDRDAGDVCDSLSTLFCAARRQSGTEASLIF